MEGPGQGLGALPVAPDGGEVPGPRFWCSASTAFCGDLHGKQKRVRGQFVERAYQRLEHELAKTRVHM